MPRKPTPLSFPVKGLVENAAFSAQPPGTTPDALNVRAYDSLERKNRGGQRIGMSKVSGDAVSGTNRIQLLEQVVEALDLVQNASWGDQYTNPSVPLISFENYKVRWNPDGDRIAIINSSDNTLLDLYSVTGTTVAAMGSAHTLDLVSAVVYDFKWNSAGDVLFVSMDQGSDNFLRAYPYDKTTGFGAALDSVTGAGSAQTYCAVTPDDNAVVLTGRSSPYVEAWPWDGSSFGTKFSDPSTLPGDGTGTTQYADHAIFNSDGDVFFYYDSGASAVGAYAFDSATGWGTKYSDAPTGGGIYGLTVNDTTTFVCNGNLTNAYLWPFDKVTGFGSRSTLATGGAGRDPQFSPDGAYLLISDQTDGDTSIFPFSTTIGTKITTPATLGAGPYSGAWSPNGRALSLAIGTGGTTNRGLVTYAFTPAGTNPSARESRVVAMSGGSVYRSSTDLATFSIVSGGSTAFSSTNPAPMADTAFQKLFFVDGISANYQYLDFADNTLKDWAGDLTAGSLPQGTTDTTLGARIITVYRGRVVLSGLREEPQNWFMSVAGDPFDFDYSPTTITATQAVAGNNSDVGELGDIVTALAPYQDDLLVMGAANSIWVMRGDPAAGGQIDNLVRGIGIVGPHAWCFDDSGVFYFFAVTGLYRVPAGLASPPELISKNKLDKTFGDLDVSSEYIRLEYDPIWQGVHIFEIPESQPASNAAAPMHYFWDARNDAFWPDQYPASIGPTATLYFNDDNPEKSGVLVGGWDSYVRRFDEDALDDDGTAISSRVQFTAENSGMALADTKISEIHINLDRGSSDVNMKIYTGQTVEDAVQDANLRFSRTLVGGRNNAIRQRARGNALVMELSQATAGSTWAYENGVALYETMGKSRRRRQ